MNIGTGTSDARSIIEEVKNGKVYKHFVPMNVLLFPLLISLFPGLVHDSLSFHILDFCFNIISLRKFSWQSCLNQFPLLFSITKIQLSLSQHQPSVVNFHIYLFTCCLALPLEWKCFPFYFQCLRQCMPYYQF